MPGMPLQVGLMNLGNSCFMNATLQALSSSSDRLSIARYNITNTNFPLASAFLDLAYQVHSSNRPVHPVRFRAVFVAQFPFFDSGDQQDAFEFVTLLLDAMHEETMASTKTQTPIPVAFNLTAFTSRQLTRIARSYQGKSPIAADFQGQLLIRTVGNCGCVSGKFEPFFGLSVPLVTAEGTVIGNLQDAISEFQRPQPLTGGDQWQCDACSKRVDAQTQSVVFRAPKILIINLKRFRFTSSGRVEKLGHLVEYPAELEISDQHFQLFAVVLHSGSPSSGHYTALAIDAATGAWRKFNDQYVRDAPEAPEKPSAEAYVLFYRQTSRSPSLSP